MDEEWGWGVGVDLPASWMRNRDVGQRERRKLHKGPGCAWGDQDHGMLALTFLPHLLSSNKVLFYLTSQEGTLSLCPGGDTEAQGGHVTSLRSWLTCSRGLEDCHLSEN